jgi:zinc transporter ZupT
MIIVLLACLTSFSTLLGGLFAFRHRDRLHRILGFTAGIILGVIAFDVLPEIAALAEATGTDFKIPMVALVIGFLVFHIVEKVLLVHTAHEHEYADGHHHPTVGLASALALAAHSFTDGIAIGLAFQVGSRPGFAIAVAIIAHDFVDGLNTVSLMLSHGNSRHRSALLLLLDTLMPLLGAAMTLLFRVPETGLLIYLGGFAGFLLYIGASDILPEAHADHASLATLALTVAGAGLMYLVSGMVP